MSGYLVKLVRDRIASVAGDTATVAYQPIERDQHVSLLRRKLVEEAIEYLEDPSASELADVLEVVRSLAHVDLGLDFAAIDHVAATKRIERGGFDRGVGMFTRGPNDS